ncbi:MAG: MATE family efflux transporter [Lachnospiraceae bacterium]|nr:MATE family efflux transporter [Lachnospiraceae bacterium]
MFSFFKDKNFMRVALTIAIPVAVQNIINTGINFADTLMVATLDSASVASVGIANNVFYFWNTFSFGIISGGMVLCSQFYGANKTSALRKTYGLTIIIDFIASMIFFIPCFTATKKVLEILTTSPKLINVGKDYLKIVCFMYPIQSVTFTTLLILRSFGKVKITVFSSLATMITNIILNYILINGHFGAPALGVVGAAIATIVSRLLEAVILVTYLFVSKSVLVEKLSDLIAFFDREYLSLYFRTSIVTVIDEFVYGLGSSLYMVIYGRLPAVQVSAVTIVNVIYDLLLVFFIGFGSACSVIIGMDLGKNDVECAKKKAKYFIELFVLLSIIFSIVTFLSKGFVCKIYENLGTETVHYINLLMIVVSIFMLVGNYGFLFMVGILRAGGDIKITIAIDLLSCWCLGVVFTFLSVMVWKQPIHIAYAWLLTDAVTKGIFGYMRYRKFKWANNLVSNVN